jgi:predicted dehydrogenase
MRFALLGSHPDGVALAQALMDSGRHALVCVSGDADAGRWPEVRRVSDAEEVLADPAVEAVIVAGPIGVRAEQMRRALQSERPVLCVHPADEKPDAAYEAGMIQADLKQPLVPLLYESLHPALRRLAAFVDRDGSSSPVGGFRLLLYERQAAGEVLLNEEVGQRPAFPGWDILRHLGGELGEVSAFANDEAAEPGRPVLLAGRFEKGGLFQVTLVPGGRCDSWRLAVLGERGRAELYFPQGWPGPAFLEGPDGGEEHWPRWDPWPAVVEAFELAAAGHPTPMSWQDEVRLLELDDAARRSVQKRRVHLMDYQEASEEVGFKGTMALAGCGLLWGVLLLAIASMWVPRAGWLILPLLLVFVALQLFRYAVPKKPS